MRSRAVRCLMPLVVAAFATACSSRDDTRPATTSVATRTTTTIAVPRPKVGAMFVTTGRYVPTAALRELPPGVGPRPATRPVVAVYGDSLTVQAFDYVEQIAEARGWTVTGRAIGGTAPCDHVRPIEQTIAAIHPALIVVAFVGNAATPCMTGSGRVRPSPAATADRYRTDLTRIVADARRARVPLWIVRPPDMADPRYAAVGAALAPLWPQLAANAPGLVRILDARAALTPDGYRRDRPCLDFETAELGCRDGRVVVRFTDGLHLSGPARRTRYSAGGWRYATVLVGELPQA